MSFLHLLQDKSNLGELDNPELTREKKAFKNRTHLIMYVQILENVSFFSKAMSSKKGGKIIFSLS